MTALTLPRLAWLLAAMLAANGASAFDTGAGAGLLVANDSEGFQTRRLAFDYLPAYTTRDSVTGVRYAASRYAIDDWSRSAQQISGVYRHIDPATTDGVQLAAGVSRQGGRTLLTIDAGYRTPLAQGTSLELFVNRDWVETRRALDEGTRFTFAGAALEQALGAHVTVVGMAGRQDFSDGNERSHGRVKLIVQPSLDMGLTLQARYRMYHSDANELARSYFNPERYHEAMLAIGWRKRFEGWMGSLTAGVGRQQVGADGRTPTRLIEAGLESPARGKQSLRLRAGLNKSASYGGPDYTYRYAQADWLIGF
ncbi:MAG: hypothetical protein V4484_14290 [Pseudomonadota bacterium]